MNRVAYEQQLSARRERAGRRAHQFAFAGDVLSRVTELETLFVPPAGKAGLELAMQWHVWVIQIEQALRHNTAAPWDVALAALPTLVDLTRKARRLAAEDQES